MPYGSARSGNDSRRPMNQVKFFRLRLGHLVHARLKRHRVERMVATSPVRPNCQLDRLTRGSRRRLFRQKYFARSVLERPYRSDRSPTLRPSESCLLQHLFGNRGTRRHPIRLCDPASRPLHLTDKTVTRLRPAKPVDTAALPALGLAVVMSQRLSRRRENLDVSWRSPFC